MLAKYFPIIRNYVLSVSLQRKYKFYHQNALLDAFRTSSRNTSGRNPLMVIPLVANRDLTPMLSVCIYVCVHGIFNKEADFCVSLNLRSEIFTMFP